MDKNTAVEADEVPDEVAILLGRIVFYGGRVDTLLGRLVPPKGEQPGSRGLSGKQLTGALADHASNDPALAAVLAGYEEQYEWRNRIIHGALSLGAAALWIWHIPIGGRGAAAQSFQLRITDLERLAESWRNLADAAHALLHRNQPDGPADG